MERSFVDSSCRRMMMLAASPGCSIRVTARCRQAAELHEALGKLIESRFGEEV